MELRLPKEVNMLFQFASKWSGGQGKRDYVPDVIKDDLLPLWNFCVIGSIAVYSEKQIGVDIECFISCID